uniref:Putative secreted protein n=1 Tax=Amblyomma parvum TaxID=251391 RepID=A0A023G021_AMBPA
MLAVRKVFVFFFSFTIPMFFAVLSSLVNASHLPLIYGLRSCDHVSCQLYLLDPTTRRPFLSPLYSRCLQRRMVGPLYFYELLVCGQEKLLLGCHSTFHLG